MTVPYACRDIMDNVALYPPGWTHRAYFAPRQEKNKKARAGQEQEGSVVDTLIQAEERAAVVRQQEQEDAAAAELARASQAGLQA